RVPPGSDPSAALGLARELASKPRLTLAAALAAVHHGMDAAIDDGLAIEEAEFARNVPTHDAREGVAAFLEMPPALPRSPRESKSHERSVTTDRRARSLSRRRGIALDQPELHLCALRNEVAASRRCRSRLTCRSPDPASQPRPSSH